MLRKVKPDEMVIESQRSLDEVDKQIDKLDEEQVFTKGEPQDSNNASPHVPQTKKIFTLQQLN